MLELKPGQVNGDDYLTYWEVDVRVMSVMSVLMRDRMLAYFECGGLTSVSVTDVIERI